MCFPGKLRIRNYFVLEFMICFGIQAGLYMFDNNHGENKMITTSTMLYKAALIIIINYKSNSTQLHTLI